MKKILILLYAAMFLMLGACEDILDKNPTDQLSSGTFWSTKGTFDMALASCYSTLQGYYICTGLHDLDGISDNSFSLFNYRGELQINSNITPSLGAIKDWYNDGYSRLARYNIFLKNLENYEGTDMSAETKSQYEAEVRMLRALEYYRLHAFFGEVPLVTEPLTVETQMVAKSPAGDVFDQIIKDCDFAIANLPNKTFDGNNGHFVKAAAYQLKARAYLYVAYDESGNAKSDVMNKVIEATTLIINDGLFNLGASYRGLFSYSIGEQTGNPEYVFAVNFLAPNNSKQGLWGFNISTMQFYWQSVYALPSLLDAYEFSDGTPYNPDDPRVDPDYLIKNRDPRMAATVFKDTVFWEDGTKDAVPHQGKTSLLYIFWKTCDLEEVKQNGGVSNQKQNTEVNGSVPIMRYAEVLLSHAEAINEVSGPTSDVYNVINQIRERAGMPNLPLGLSKDEMRMRIRNERRVELAFEGFRYFDIKRWKIAEEVINGINDGQITRKFETKNYLWPLPEQEVLVNTALEQNPDY